MSVFGIGFTPFDILWFEGLLFILSVFKLVLAALIACSFKWKLTAFIISISSAPSSVEVLLNLTSNVKSFLTSRLVLQKKKKKNWKWSGLLHMYKWVETTTSSSSFFSFFFIHRYLKWESSYILDTANIVL